MLSLVLLSRSSVGIRQRMLYLQWWIHYVWGLGIATLEELFSFVLLSNCSSLLHKILPGVNIYCSSFMVSLQPFSSNFLKPGLTALEIWVYTINSLFFRYLPLNHTQSIPVELNSLVASMKDKTEICNPWYSDCWLDMHCMCYDAQRQLDFSSQTCLLLRTPMLSKWAKIPG